jgi:hypothetical protein
LRFVFRFTTDKKSLKVTKDVPLGASFLFVYRIKSGCKEKEVEYFCGIEIKDVSLQNNNKIV